MKNFVFFAKTVTNFFHIFIFHKKYPICSRISTSSFDEQDVPWIRLWLQFTCQEELHCSLITWPCNSTSCLVKSIFIPHFDISPLLINNGILFLTASISNNILLLPMTIGIFTIFILQMQPPRVVLRKGVLKICTKFIGEHTWRSVISVKLLCNFIEITLRHGCSPVNLLHIFKTPFLFHYKQLPFCPLHLNF